MTLENLTPESDTATLVLRECPICPARRGEDYRAYANHLKSHGPEEFGLSTVEERQPKVVA